MRIHANFDRVGTEFEAQVRLTCWPAHTDRATVLLQGKVVFFLGKSTRNAGRPWWSHAEGSGGFSSTSDSLFVFDFRLEHSESLKIIPAIQ